MGLFGNIFGNETQEQEEKAINWIPLTDLNQLETINASDKLTVIFKGKV